MIIDELIANVGRRINGKHLERENGLKEGKDFEDYKFKTITYTFFEKSKAENGLEKSDWKRFTMKSILLLLMPRRYLRLYHCKINSTQIVITN